MTEEVLFKGRPAWAAYWGRLALSGLCVVGAVALAVVAARTDPATPARAAAFVGACVALVAALFLALGVLIRRLGLGYTVTNQRAVLSEGLVTKRTNEVELADIRNVTVEQGILGRIFGFGDLGISSAGGGGIEIVFQSVQGPERVKEILRTQRRAAAPDE